MFPSIASILRMCIMSEYGILSNLFLHLLMIMVFFFFYYIDRFFYSTLKMALLCLLACLFSKERSLSFLSFRVPPCVCVVSLFSGCLQDCLLIFGFQEFDEYVSRSSYLYIQLGFFEVLDL